MSGSHAHEGIARAALLEITPATTVGDYLDAEVLDDGVVNLRFASRQPGYQGWSWVVSVADIDDGGDATVLELELLPGEGALLSPDWVPWSVRLAEWETHQAELAESGEAVDDADADDDDSDDDDDHDDDDDDDDSDDDSDDDDDVDEDDIDDDIDDEDPGVRSTHSGDLDGIDIDDFDPDAGDDEE